MTNKKEFTNSIYTISDHLKHNISTFVWVGIFCVVGIVVGIVLLFGEKSYISLLTSKNQNMLGYISGTASIFSIFGSRLATSMLALIVVFAFCLNYFTSYFCYFYFAYQSAICTLVCGTLISYQGLSAILNTILLIIPSNIILLIILAFSFSVFAGRARVQYKYKQQFWSSFSNNNFIQFLLLSIVAIITLNIITGLIIPLIIKGIFQIYY